jgi:hypothetical protein
MVGMKSIYCESDSCQACNSGFGHEPARDPNAFRAAYESRGMAAIYRMRKVQARLDRLRARFGRNPAIAAARARRLAA